MRQIVLLVISAALISTPRVKTRVQIVGDTLIETGAAGTSLPGTCNLKAQDNVWPISAQQPIVYRIDRNNGRIPWTSGAPIWFDAPEVLPGWDVLRGVDLFAHFDYPCFGPDSSPNVLQCQYHGTPQEIASHCEQDPMCRAFSYISNSSALPVSSPYSPVGRWSVGVLKGGPKFDLELAFSAGNPSSVIYWKPGLHAPTAKTSPGVYAGISIAAVIIGIAAVLSMLLLARRLLRGSQRPSQPNLPAINKPGTMSRQPLQRLLSDVAVHRQESHDSLAPSIPAAQLPGSAICNINPGDPLLPHGDLGAWQISPGQISICRRPTGEVWLAGEGASGQVFKALQDGVTVVAVKQLHSNLDNRQSQAFLREIATLRNLHSPHINSHGLPLDPLGWYGRGQDIALDVAKGLHHLHSRNLIHLDLKSSNILLRQGTAKIADVGFAKILSQSVHSQQVIGGTWAWAAPEVLLGRHSTTQADIYSFGVVMWELVTGESPVRGKARDVLVPLECPAEIKLLLNECFDTDPRKRPTARTIVHRLEASSSSRPLS
ncbi:hypothetical protein WJX74_008589 [Apatococcus lobatus]|uniref:Protein kinase domain-containing protein n=1 Tax=Apatococcus lobatus TaxID=904363 RepID=A0AAW1R9Z3_9CHLO